MFDLVPLARAWREMPNMNDHLQRCGKTLKLYFPQPDASAVAAAAIGGNQELFHSGIHQSPHCSPPSTDRFHRELGRVVRHSHADPPFVATDVIYTVGNCLAQLLVRKIMDVDLDGLPFLLPFPSAVFDLQERLA